MFFTHEWEWETKNCCTTCAISHYLCHLDGLDEMADAVRSACIEAINSYRQAHLVPWSFVREVMNTCHNLPA